MRMPAGWNIRVTTFDSEGNPRIVRNFLAYESDKEGAIELVRKRVPVNEGELAEAVAEVSGNEFVGPGMRPGDVRRRTLTRGSSLLGMPEAAWGPEPRPCPSRKSYPHVAMMQSGPDLCGDDGPRSLDGASSRRVKCVRVSL
jgi:hypothetical protein